LKTVATEKAPEGKQLSSLNSEALSAGAGTNIINAPSSLPNPPLEWLRSMPLKVDLPPAEIKKNEPSSFYQSPPVASNVNGFPNVPFFSNPGVFFASNNGMPIRPLPVPGMPVPLMAQPFPQQPLQRFFQNNQNQLNQRPKQMNNSHLYQQRQLLPQHAPQQMNQQAPNPFIPLQASRKATKPKNVHVEVKTVNPSQEQMKPQQETPQKAAVDTASSQGIANQIGTSKPTVDNRRCRVAIDFSK
jgi:hypothetical protein